MKPEIQTITPGEHAIIKSYGTHSGRYEIKVISEDVIYLGYNNDNNSTFSERGGYYKVIDNYRGYVYKIQKKQIIANDAAPGLYKHFTSDWVVNTAGAVWVYPVIKKIIETVKPYI